MQTETVPSKSLSSKYYKGNEFYGRTKHRHARIDKIMADAGITRDEYRILKQTYNNMRKRCYNHNDRAYHYYGGRGIRISDNWLNDFTQFCIDMGPRPEGMSIDRIDVNGDYCKENCRWANAITQNRNQRSNKVTQEIVEDLVRDHSLGFNYTELGDMYGLTPKHVGDIVNGRKFVIDGLNDETPTYVQWNRKLLFEDVREMTRLYQEGETFTDIGKRFGVDRTTVRDAVRGKSYRDYHEKLNETGGA